MVEVSNIYYTYYSYRLIYKSTYSTLKFLLVGIHLVAKMMPLGKVWKTKCVGKMRKVYSGRVLTKVKISFLLKDFLSCNKLTIISKGSS